MFIADTHCDTLSAITTYGHTPKDVCVTPERLSAGNVGLQTFALFCADTDSENAYRKTLKMLDNLDCLGVPILTGALPDAFPTTPTGILSCEGGEMFCGSMDRFEELHARARFRMIALTWNYENEIGHPASEGPEGGLKPFGIELLKRMDTCGVLPDVSHLNEAGFWDVCEHASLPPIASHSNARWLCDVPRNLNRDQVSAIVEKKGYIGINFYRAFLTEAPTATLEDVYRHIAALCEAGAEDCVGFGSDFDGISEWPEGLATPADFPRLLEYLSSRGFADAQLEKFAHGNLWRVLKAAERHE